MLFTSLNFAVFLAVVLALFYLLPQPARKYLLLGASLWFYISLVPSLFRVWEEMRVYLIQVSTLGFIGFLIFLLWPTAVPAPDIDWSQHPSVAFLKSVDASGNACPSSPGYWALSSRLFASWARSAARCLSWRETRTTARRRC